ncbi:MAG: RnfH family protein [Candidatus Eutrophobiaceae bacterium]
MADIERFFVEVAYVGSAVETDGSVFSRRMEMQFGQCVRDAIEASGVLGECPDIDLAVNCVGIHGRLCDLDGILKPGDRVEIYRPLKADPKELRRRRASKRNRHRS